jgi:hypothetical protein
VDRKNRRRIEGVLHVGQTLAQARHEVNVLLAWPLEPRRESALARPHRGAPRFEYPVGVWLRADRSVVVDLP